MLEVSAPKPGNITPGHDFADTTYADMVRSALALGPAFIAPARRAARGVGAADRGRRAARPRESPMPTRIWGSCSCSRRWCGPRRPGEPDESLRSATERTLGQLDVDDAAAAFAAIVQAHPGGLGEAPEHDVRAPARVSLREAMAAAAHRDSIASEYATGYAIVFDTGLPLLTDALAGGARTLDAIVSLHVGLLASHPDTLIERKAGAAAAQAVTAAAREVRAGTRTLEEFDASLRGPDHRLNPGTTADLVAATLLVALLTGVALP